MDKQEQIKEISDICGDIATALYEAGYRKERDTAREILKKIRSYVFEKEKGMIYLLEKLGKEYGVEVE